MDDVNRRYLIISLSVYIVLSLFMLLLGLSMQTAARFPDSHLERMKDNRKARRVAALQEEADLLRFRVLSVQTLCGAVTALDLFLLWKPLYELIAGSLTVRADGHLLKTVCVTAIVFILLISIYMTLCTELPRKAAKTGRLSGERGESFALASVGYLSFMLTLFRPYTLLCELLMKGFGAVFGVKPEITDETGEDLIQLIDAQSEDGGIEEEEAEMISNIFEFSDLELHEVMTHRTEIAAAELGASVGEVVDIAVETGFSRIPIYRETIDEICGVVYVKDLLPLVTQGRSGNIPVSRYLRKIKYVPESGSCGELFSYFTENNRHIAAVLDEYGGTAGLVTMEDLLECIVGNIRDEYDEDEEEEIEEITPHTYDILGSADPDEAMELLGAPLPEDHEYDTMGGFVTDLLGFIPDDGQTPTATYKNITFRVISARDNRIEKLRAVKKDTDIKEAAGYDEK